MQRLCMDTRVHVRHEIRIQNAALKTVDHLKYLDSVLSSDHNTDADIMHRIDMCCQKR